MGHPTFLAKTALLVAGTLLLAGCAGGGSKRSDSEAYVGEDKEFDLYLYGFRSTNGRGGWDLYPGANVDFWAFSPEADRTKATIPGPEIRAREGDTVRINFWIDSSAPMAHTIHWHGIHVPWDQDGVPYTNQIPMGMTVFGGNGTMLYTYEFTLKQSGTYWYHCHVDTAHHLDMGMYGAFIVDPADPDQDPKFDQEVTLTLDEWDRGHAHDNQQAILYAISKSGDPKVTANDFYAAMRDYIFMHPLYDNLSRRADQVGDATGVYAPGVRETRDWYPVTYAPFFAEYDTFLINGRAFPNTEPIFVKTGDVLRMRFINAGEQVHSMHLHGHHMLVTHSDGYKLPAPYYKDTILIGPGERYDVYVTMDNPGPWHIHDHISLNEQNDYIWPGGMSTMICYRDGWVNAADCDKGHRLHVKGETVTAGDLLNDQAEFLQRAAAGSGSPSSSNPTAPGGTSTGSPSTEGVLATPTTGSGLGLPVNIHAH